MKLRKINLKDFGVFSEAELVLNEKNTVLFGINGTGKTTVLRSINLLYASIINGIVNRRELRQQYNIKLEDIRFGKPLTVISGQFVLHKDDETAIQYERQMIRSTGKRTHSRHTLEMLTRPVQEAYRSDEEQGNIPIFVNYGTNRLVLDIPLRIRTHHEFDIYSAYEKAIENRIDFRTFFEWYRNQEDMENAQKVELGDLHYTDKSLNAVRKAVLSFLPEFSKVFVARKPRLAMMVEKEGMRLNVSQLSDGEKCIMAMLGDLARRLALANPQSDDPLQGEGVVLIDEVELHMHPTWQRKILGLLKNTFPNIQFIVTTHSPQVLGELDDSYNVFALESFGKNESRIETVSRMDGFDSSYILEEFMGTDAKNIRTKKLITEIHRCISQKEYRIVNEKLAKLKEIAGSLDDQYIIAKGTLERSSRLDEKD